jgi:TRAP-type C4-dicarboxylate transport system permease small subunit
MTETHSGVQTVPPALQGILRSWHRVECWAAVAAFGFIAGILVLDVFGREFVGPVAKALGYPLGATGIPSSQRMSVYALVVGSFCGIGIATATGSHLVPRVAFGWIPAAWGTAMNRFADLFTGVFLVAVAWFGFEFVMSSMETDLRAPILNWSVWPFQLAIPVGFLSAAGRYLIYAIYPSARPIPPEFQE